MANIDMSQQESTFQIKKWFGVNENPDGDTKLKIGEASESRNWRITKDGSLKIRPGTKSKIAFTSEYKMKLHDAENLFTEYDVSTRSMVMYPSYEISETGGITLTGTSLTVTYANRAAAAGYYYQYGDKVYKFSGCSYTQPTSGTIVDGGSVRMSTASDNLGLFYQPLTAPDAILTYGVSSLRTYSAVRIRNRVVELSGDSITSSGLVADGDTSFLGRYWAIVNPPPGYGVVGMISKITACNGTYAGTGYDLYGNAVMIAGEDIYVWSFQEVELYLDADINVACIKSLYVGGEKMLLAACNNALWKVSYSSETWSKTEIGAIDTSGSVTIFGFQQNAYILDGHKYYTYNGTTLSEVTGYRPMLTTETPPAGGGTSLEQVNKLCGLRRAQYSPDGTAKDFHLADTGIASVDYVKNTVTGTEYTVTTDYTVNLTTGVVTFITTPTAGIDTIEIGWTVSTTYRSQVEAMRYAETYNGATDTRVFIYGDGSNKALYSGLDINGTPRADYFPDLNEMAVDSANTPITAMIKHFSQLLTFKPDGAFITTYGTITTASGTTTSAFYTTPLNREIGNIAPGQATLVKNNPFTLYGRSVYEWVMNNYSAKDERIAKCKSDRVCETLKSLDLANCVCYDDEYNTEYYIVQGGTAAVYNYTTDTWSIYTGFNAKSFVSIDAKLYIGTNDGKICNVSDEYRNDNGNAIDAYWKSGAMDFGQAYRLKYSSGIWISLKPTGMALVNVGISTSKASVGSQKSVSSGLATFKNASFQHWSFGTNRNSNTRKININAKKFTYYYLIFESNSISSTATIQESDIRVGFMGNVK